MNPSQEGFWDGEGKERRFWPACDYPTTQKQIVEANGIRFWVETEGEGRPLVLIHGGPGIDHRYFHPQISALSKERQVIYYDLRGHYMSSEPQDGEYGFEQDAKDLEALRQALAFQKIDILGHSYGGGVALKYASLFPEHLSHLIVCSTPVGMTVEEFQKRRASHPLSEAMRQEKDPDVQEELWFRLYYRKPLDIEFRRLLRERQKYYETSKNKRVLAGYKKNEKRDDEEWNSLMISPPQIAVPVLFICGRHDPLFSLERAQQWIAQLNQAKMVILEESSHYPFIDEPEAFAQKVKAFLES